MTIKKLTATALLTLPMLAVAADDFRLPATLAQAPAGLGLPEIGSAPAAPTETAWSKYGPYNVYLGLGTSGLAVGTSFAGTSWYNGRAEFNRLTFKTNDSTRSLDYNVDLRLQNQAAYFDVRPFSGTFRLSLGISSQQSNLDIMGDGTLDSGAKARANARVELPSVMPYVGLGWGLGKNKPGFGMFFDVGAFVGTPKLTTFTLTSNDPAVQAEANRELPQKRRELEEDISKLKVYPVIKTGFTYHF